MKKTPYIIGIGGTARPGSNTEKALRAALDVVQRLGARTELFAAEAMDLPMYDGGTPTAKATALVEAIRGADGILLASPSYHGSVSGQVKNALDYAEELSKDARPYFEGRAVGCIVCAYGVQSIGTAIVAMRTIVHSLRGWPTPLAAGIVSSKLAWEPDGRCGDADAQQQLERVAGQVWEFALMRARLADSGADAPIRAAAR